LEADIRNLAHPAEPHVGRPGDEAGREAMIIGFLFGLAAQDVLKGIHKPALPVDKMQDAADPPLFEPVGEYKLFCVWVVFFN
jgi:hypothetical protein